ncbi:hypothetical protein HMPREF1544_10105 [Mucor circinelloides 1006PhL]|uniref:Uncharacterized protein n=1 Tax=Mucor circinelloides f. circinelloides (strain 1006PhL) TaxID=1220926 RepID=S2JTM1_MUCC1|nr:hypothetical protein HMPREF1544_10105 [Mucor circinelloides 1006PhL]
MGQAISTQIKGNLIVVNMIHTIVLRLYLLLDDNVKSEDYKVHKRVSYALKNTFGDCDLLGQQ